MHMQCPILSTILPWSVWLSPVSWDLLAVLRRAIDSSCDLQLSD